jgi:transposase
MVQTQSKKKGKKPPVTANDMPMIRPDVAGIDIGSRSHWVAVPADREERPVREFSSFTGGLNELAAWLKSCRVTSVAMESTGVYWIPLYELLEQQGFEVLLVNAAHVRNVPGRKSDVLDCQWIQRLHSVGLLRGSVRPEAQYIELRAYVRQRERLVQDAARYVQHMQKALMEMNIQVHHVVSDLAGVTGMRIVRAIVKGERDGEKLAELRDGRCRQPKERIAQALQGTYKREHLFVLEQALEAYDTQQRMLKACDERIEALLAEIAAENPAPSEPCPPPRFGKPTNNQPTFEVQQPLYQICKGVDLTLIHGIAPATALRIVSEIGTDVSRWKTEKHFTSWLCLAPGTKITGGQRLSGRRPPARNRVGQALRQCAVAVGRTETALGAFYRRLAARAGAAKAAVATARKLGVLVYQALKHGQAFVETGLAVYEKQQQDRQIRNLRKRAAVLGFQLLPAPAEPAAAAG